MTIFARIALLSLVLLWPSVAQAEWREARSRNFIVYSRGSEASLRAFTEKLEKLDVVMRFIHRVTAPPSPNRLRVYLLDSQQAVATMAGAGGSGVAGYYVADSRAVLMVGMTAESFIRTPNGIADRQVRLDPESVLLHEYSHHFMAHYFPAAYPTWYSEGFAEFWGATRFLPNDVVEVGHPVNYRYGSLVLNRWLPVSRMLAAQNYADVPEADLLYAEGWLLVRYAWGNSERQRQLETYLGLVNRGRPYAAAAAEAFGDLQRLNNELYDYAGRARFDVVRLPFRRLDIGEITIRPLDAAEDALVVPELQLSQGVSNVDLPAFAARVRELGARYPASAPAQRLLAEVEILADNVPAARTAIERLLALAPADPRGLMFTARLDIRALQAAHSTDAGAWTAARRLLSQAIAAAPGDPMVREAYYDSYVAQGVLPPEDAQGMLYEALDLAPSDSDLRYRLAHDFEARQMIPEAIAMIRGDAYRLPVPREESEAARRRREAREDRERRAGTARRETAREMLTRLEARLRGQGGS